MPQANIFMLRFRRMSSLVLYHYPCPDGITAALAAHLWCKERATQLSLVPHTTFKPLSIKDLQLMASAVCFSAIL